MTCWYGPVLALRYFKQLFSPAYHLEQPARDDGPSCVAGRWSVRSVDMTA